jgi:hypothetical protein
MYRKKCYMLYLMENKKILITSQRSYNWSHSETDMLYIFLPGTVQLDGSGQN